MDIHDIKHLAGLSRLELSEEECAAYAADMNSILGYVAQVQEAATDGDGNVHSTASAFTENGMREDVVTNSPDQYTDAVVNLAPSHDGRYVVVKKILSTGDEA